MVSAEPNQISEIKVVSEVEENKSDKSISGNDFEPKKKEKAPFEAVSLRSLFRYATIVELFYLVLTIIASVCFGTSLPLSLVALGDTINAFTDRVSGYIRVTFSSICVERQARTIRQILFRSILKKDIVYFDQYKPGELNLHLTDNVNKIRDGIGDKLSSDIEMLSTCITGITIGFVEG